MPSVLVTGGCGFIGVNLGSSLVERGWETIAFDNLTSGRREDAQAVGYSRVIEGDVRDRDAVRAACNGMDFVVHLAAHTNVVNSIADPEHDIDQNVGGILSALLGARDADVDGFVFASSNAPLGEIEPPSHEGAVPHPLSPYGASKLAGEALCSAFAGSYGLPTTVLRFSNVYGPWSYHKGSVVAKYLKRIYADEPLVIYGDGEQTRDFVYVEDLVAGIVAALESGLEGEVFHLGTGVETSILQLVELLGGEFADRSFDVEFEPPRPGEILRNYSDITKARSMLGFDPTASLEDGLHDTRMWFEETMG